MRIIFLFVSNIIGLISCNMGDVSDSIVGQ